MILAACKDSKRQQSIVLLQEWSNKTIEFPSNPIFTGIERDTIGDTSGKYKIIYNYPVESHLYTIDREDMQRSVIQAESRYTQNIAGKCSSRTDYTKWELHGLENLQNHVVPPYIFNK
jgi:hypothetical protein